MSTDACANKYEPWHALKHKPLAGASGPNFQKIQLFQEPLSFGDGGGWWGEKAGDDDSGVVFQEGLEIGGQEGLDRASMEAHSGGG